MRRLTLLLLLAAPVLLAAATVADMRVDKDAATGDLLLDIVLSPTPDALVQSQVHVRNAQTGQELKVATFRYSAGTARLILAPGEKIEEKDQLLVNIDPIQVSGKPDKVAPYLYVVKQTTAGSKPQSLQKADGKDDARFYFEGQISHARSQDVVGTYDLKLAFLQRKMLGHRLAQEGPLYTLTGGNDPKGDPDSMQLGWVFNLVLMDAASPGPFVALLWENTPKIESTRDFTYTNFVYATRLRLISRAWTPAPGTRFYVRPYVGADLGRNLASEVEAARDQTIVRPVAGSTLAFVVALGGDASFNITGDYIRFWPVRNEVLITTDKSGKIVTPSVGTKARDHIKAGTGIDFNKWAGVKVSYERGSLPPAFKFVDNKITLSLVIKAK